MEFSPIKYQNKKIFMQESKAIIKELLQSIKIKTAQNQNLLVTLKDLKEQLKSRDIDLQKQRQTISALANENNSYKIQVQENKLKKQGQIQMMSTELKDKKGHLQKIQSTNNQLYVKNKQLELKCQQVSFKNQQLELRDKQLQQKLVQKEQRNLELQRSLTHSKGLVAAAQNHINFLKQQLQALRQKVAEQEINHEKQLQGLRDLNVNITQKMNFIQKDYSSIIRYNDSISNTYQSPQSRVRRPTNPKKKEKQILRQKSKESIKRDSVNPQMQNELLKIKRSISDQYEKFQETRDKFMKDRVNKTLLNIETLLSQMSEKVQNDSSSYEL